MTRLARLAVAYPRRTLAIWFAAVAVLGVIGLGVGDRLHQSTFDVPGTGSHRATELAKEQFGERNTLIILLRGPRAELDRQGKRLAYALSADKRLTVLSPSAPGAGAALRPEPDAALLLVRADLPFEEVSREVVPDVRSTVDRLVRDPVDGHVSGFADVAAGAHEYTLEAIDRAELIAAPLLLLILLLVFRSPVAAALPLLVGLTTIGAGSGALELINRSSPIDQLALNMLSMMGLALGVDYGLVLVSRFREELEAGHDRERATLIAVATAGRAVVYAGLTLALAMFGAFLIAPGALLSSGTFGVLIAVGFSVVSALVALPASLVLLGPAVNRWMLGGVLAGEGRISGVAMRALRRPALAAALVAGLIGALAVPALALDSGPGDPRAVLPTDVRERVDYEKVRDTLDGAWTAPYEITVVARNGSVTEPRTLRALGRWQRRIAARDGVLTVLGPGDAEGRTRRLERLPDLIARLERTVDTGVRDQRRLADGLGRAGEGARQLRAGLGEAAAGVRELAAGAEAGGAGGRQLVEGLGQAVEGASLLNDGLALAGAGGGALARGAGTAADGADRLEDGVGQARRGLSNGLPRVEELVDSLREGAQGLERLREPAQLAEQQLATALEALEAMAPTSKLDPQYRRAYEAVATASGAVTGRDPRTGDRLVDGYDGLDKGLADAAAGARRATAGVQELLTQLRELEDGLAQLEAGAGRLREGNRQLAGGATRLDAGLDQLAGGSSALVAGLRRLHEGAGALTAAPAQLGQALSALADGLGEGADRTEELAGGLERMRSGVRGAAVRTRRLGQDLGGSGRLSETFGSGYFVLAALDTAPEDDRDAASFAINLDRGGSAAQLSVIAADDPYKVILAGHPLRGELERSLADLERETGLETAVGGPAAQLQDYDAETSGRLLLLILALAALTFAALVVMFRSLLVPLLAVLLNLLTIGAAFGVLALLYGGIDAPLGGPGSIDGISVLAIFAVAFGLSIDYEVFMLARIREGYTLTGTTDGAIAYGLPRAASVITGGALIMTGVFAAFALADVLTMRQIGIGLTVAVLLDATLVRLLLLPAAIRLLGDASWWLPAPLRRLMPEPRAPA